MVELAFDEKGWKEGWVMQGLDSFYIMGAILLLVVALVYWADAIREKKVKRK